MGSVSQAFKIYLAPNHFLEFWATDGFHSMFEDSSVRTYLVAVVRLDLWRIIVV